LDEEGKKEEPLSRLNHFTVPGGGKKILFSFGGKKGRGGDNPTLCNVTSDLKRGKLQPTRKEGGAPGKKR